jgi:hypothetical protein
MWSKKWWPWLTIQASNRYYIHKNDINIMKLLRVENIIKRYLPFLQIHQEDEDYTKLIVKIFWLNSSDDKGSSIYTSRKHENSPEKFKIQEITKCVKFGEDVLADRMRYGLCVQLPLQIIMWFNRREYTWKLKNYERVTTKWTYNNCIIVFHSKLLWLHSSKDVQYF